MEGENSNDDVVAITELKEEEDKPIMGLFRRLISSDNKQNTVLTNAQIKDILKKEFYIDSDSLHELEEDIYLNVMKKFLKDWPQWDEFDQTIVNYKSKGDYTGLNSVLQVKYKSLKKYLRLMLSIAEPFARDNVKNAEAVVAKNSKPNNLDDIVLEVHCNRAQLNKLFFRQPYPNKNGTVFNIDDAGPSRITVTKPTISGILNSFGICIGLSIHSATITRFTCHVMDHVLVNKKLRIPRQNHSAIPNERLEYKMLMKPINVDKKVVLDNLASAYKKFKLRNFSEAVTVLKVIIEDIAEGPKVLQVPSRYRKFMSKYVYKRYLNADLPDETELSEKYDLQLVETISPRYQYTMHRYGTGKEKMYSLQIECTQCSVKFKGLHLLTDLEQHYLAFHSDEPDVVCANCNKSFSVDYLSDKRWHHEC